MPGAVLRAGRAGTTWPAWCGTAATTAPRGAPHRRSRLPRPLARVVDSREDRDWQTLRIKSCYDGRLFRIRQTASVPRTVHFTTQPVRRWLPIAIGLPLAALAVAAVVRSTLHASASRLQRELTEARQARAAGDVSSAAEHYDKYRIAAGGSADPDAMVERALVALELAAAPEAGRALMQHAVGTAFEAMRQRPDDIDLRRRLADLQMASRDYAGAREHLLWIRESIAAGTADDDPAAVDLAIARTWHAARDDRQALDIVARLTGFDVGTRSFVDPPPDPPAATGAYLLLAEILRGEFDDAAAADAAVERCVQAHPDDPEALVSYARTMLASDDAEAALRAASRAAELSPGNAAATLAHGLSLVAKGEHAAACAVYVDGLRGTPDDKPLFATAARQVASRGAPEQVLEVLDQVWDRLPYQEYDCLVFLAGMRIDWKARSAFAERLERARDRLGADHPAVTVLEARVLEAQRDWAAAEKSLVKARAIVPRESKWRIDEMLARCLAALGEPDAAIVVYRRLEAEPSRWWFATSGLAEANLELGRTDDAAEFVEKLSGRWAQSLASEERANGRWQVLPSLPVMIRVIAAQPAERRDFSAVESMIETLAVAPSGESNFRIAVASGELLAAKGDFDAAESALPRSTEDAARPEFDPLRVSLVGRRAGVAAMREAFEALPTWRRARGEVLAAAARVEASFASGDDRDWLRSCAAASDTVPAATEAVQLLQALAASAREAGWPDEARAVWERAAARNPGDFRPHLALAIDAARRGDAAAAAAAATRVVAIEGAPSPRGRVASAAALIAAVRAEPESRSPPSAGSGGSGGRLREATSLLVEAENDRKRWQPVHLLLGEIESIQGNAMAEATQLERAVECGPNDPLLVLDLAAACDRALRRADAERFRDMVAPACVGGCDRQAIDALLRAGDPRSAARRALVAIDVETADVRTLSWLCRLCVRAGLQEWATALATRATRLAPDDPEGWLRLAECRMAESNRDAAEAALSEGCGAVAPAGRALLEARGDAVLGRIADAERRFRDVLEHAGDDAEPAAYLVDFLMQQGRGKEAETLLEDVFAGRWGTRSLLQRWADARLRMVREASGE